MSKEPAREGSLRYRYLLLCADLREAQAHLLGARNLMKQIEGIAPIAADGLEAHAKTIEGLLARPGELDRPTLKRYHSDLLEAAATLRQFDPDRQTCEQCGEPRPADEPGMSFEDGPWFCDRCAQRWKDEIAKCEHVATGEGEERQCDKCGMLMVDPDFDEVDPDFDEVEAAPLLRPVIEAAPLLQTPARPGDVTFGDQTPLRPTRDDDYSF